MPYICKNNDRREKLRNGEPALTAGELNYQIFYYVKHYYPNYLRILSAKLELFVKQFLGEKPNYQRYNDMTGALVRCYKELNRRLGINANFLVRIMDSYDDEIAEYEDTKIKQNGDVE